MSKRRNEIAEICTTLYFSWRMHPDLSFGEFLHEYIFPKIQVTMGGCAFELRAPKACDDRDVLKKLKRAMK